MKKPLQKNPISSADPPICPVRILLDQLADRWAVLVLLSLAEAPVRFNSLRRAVNGVTQKVLGQTLRRLERNGLIQRTVIASKPIAVEYRLTPTGQSLLPIIQLLRQWALSSERALLSARAEFDDKQAA